MSRSVLLFILVPTALLLVLGLVMQGSISPVMARREDQSEYFHLHRQLMFGGAGLAGMFLVTFIPYRWLQRLITPLYLITLVALVLCFFPPIGVKLNGASRWLNLGFQFQPSEIAKLLTLIAVAAWATKYGEYQKTFLHGFLIPILIIAAPMVLIGMEVDLGNAALLGVGAFAVLFVAGTRIHYLILSVIGAVTVAAGIIMFIPAAKERIGRVTSFLGSQASAGDSMQQDSSLLALGTGGDWGLGLGAGVVKRSNGLPFANSDFIFPVIGEEMGLAATVGVILCYAFLCIGGIMISVHAADRFGKLVAFGITTLITAQAILHIGVCLKSLPNKGAALPLVSAGGTGLIVVLLSIGVLCSIYRTAGSLQQPRTNGLRRGSDATTVA